VVEALQTTSFGKLSTEFLSTKEKKVLNEFGSDLQEFLCNAQNANMV